jgi:hypothetical protein
MTTEVFREEGLVLNVCHEAATERVVWSGKSTARDPAKFILRVLLDAAARSTESGALLILDFRDVSYMNSSTITPIIRMLDRAKRAETRVSVVYRKELHWQELSFSALRVFQTQDGRIEVRGV